MARLAVLCCILLWGTLAMAQDKGNYETFKDAVIGRYGAGLYRVLDDPVAYRAEVERLPANVPEITAANMLILEVKNGGFWQYFYNSYGITIDEAIRGLQHTQNHEYARIAIEAAARFPGDVPERRGERIALVGEYNDRDKIRFRDLDRRFYAVPRETEDEYWERFEALAKQLLRDNGD